MVVSGPATAVGCPARTEASTHAARAGSTAMRRGRSVAVAPRRPRGHRGKESADAGLHEQHLGRAVGAPRGLGFVHEVRVAEHDVARDLLVAVPRGVRHDQAAGGGGVVGGQAHGVVVGAGHAHDLGAFGGDRRHACRRDVGVEEDRAPQPGDPRRPCDGAAVIAGTGADERRDAVAGRLAGRSASTANSTPRLLKAGRPKRVVSSFTHTPPTPSRVASAGRRTSGVGVDARCEEGAPARILVVGEEPRRAGAARRRGVQRQHGGAAQYSDSAVGAATVGEPVNVSRAHAGRRWHGVSARPGDHHDRPSGRRPARAVSAAACLGSHRPHAR